MQCKMQCGVEPGERLYSSGEKTTRELASGSVGNGLQREQARWTGWR